jgi:hypothetical protein
MRHTPHPFHISKVRVGILQCHQRAVGGPLASVIDYFYREDSVWLVLQLPNGGRAATPATWTDLPPETLPRPPHQRLLHPPALVAMTGLCRRLRKVASKRRPK